MVFLLSLKQAIHLKVNGKNAPHIPVATRLLWTLTCALKLEALS